MRKGLKLDYFVAGHCGVSMSAATIINAVALWWTRLAHATALCVAVLLLQSKSVLAEGAGGGPDGAERPSTVRVGGSASTKRDSPAARLASNFLRVVFDPSELKQALDQSAQVQSPILMKWVGPVFYRVVGDGVRAADTVAAVLLAARIEEIIGLEVRPAISGRSANLTVFILGPGLRSDLAAQLREAITTGEIKAADPVLAAWLMDGGIAQKPNLSDRPTAPIREVPQVNGVDCAVSLTEASNRIGTIEEAIVMIRAEVPAVLRDRCLQRDFLAAFGLSNPHADIAPSILDPMAFYAQPTEQDLQMLEMLYDARILPALTRAQTEPLVSAIAQELVDKAASENARRAGTTLGEGDLTPDTQEFATE